MNVKLYNKLKLVYHRLQRYICVHASGNHGKHVASRGAHFALEPRHPLHQEGFRTRAKDIGTLNSQEKKNADISSNATSW